MTVFVAAQVSETGEVAYEYGHYEPLPNGTNNEVGQGAPDSGAGVGTVIVAISIPEIPRVARLVRGVVLSVRNEPYVEAAIGAGTRLPKLLARHVLPNTVAPLIVQGTYVMASAVLTEAILSFLGAGIPTEIPSWGNIMAEGRQAFQIAPWTILFPGLCVAATVLAVNVIGDGLRDALDPRTAKGLGVR